MKTTKAMLVGAMLVAATTTLAGGILTNTNQSVDFLRNPARDAAIGLDGVYSNPAGVAFMPEGLHLAFNWQYAHQTRTITSTNPLFALGKKNNESSTKTFEGVADAPIIPSLQAAYNKGDWSFQFNFSIPGGGGKCEFDNGLGSFESVVGSIASQMKPLGVTGYDMDGYMQGRQYFFGFQLGAAYKINPNLSIYGGLRVLYGDASYKAKISNIEVYTADPTRPIAFGSFLNSTIDNFEQNLGAVNQGIGQYEAAGVPVPEDLLATKAQLEGTLQTLTPLQKYEDGINLQCDQTGVGIAPVLGIDYKVSNFNFAAKYEFKTPMKMKNKSTLDKVSEIPAMNKFLDGEKVAEDSPALLTLGAQWSVRPDVRVNLGYHHFFDKNATWYGNTQDLLDHDTNEFLAGAEWDLNDKFTISAGGQLTRYGLTDAYMNDLSFVVSSYSFGFGASYKVKDNVRLTAAYFQTNYEDYDKVTSAEPRISDSFTRTNRVLGLGVEVTF